MRDAEYYRSIGMENLKTALLSMIFANQSWSTGPASLNKAEDWRAYRIRDLRKFIAVTVHKYVVYSGWGW